jgi:hypothetical protein
VMTLTKMAPSGWRYYAEEVASGREDYYAVSSEHLGRFVGRGAIAFGLEESDVSPAALEWLFGTGADPRTGKALGRGFAPDNARVVAGFATSFSPPKSVSVLWACADEETSAEVLAAHESAVEVQSRSWTSTARSRDAATPASFRSTLMVSLAPRSFTGRLVPLIPNCIRIF